MYITEFIRSNTNLCQCRLAAKFQLECMPCDRHEYTLSPREFHVPPFDDTLITQDLAAVVPIRLCQNMLSNSSM